MTELTHQREINIRRMHIPLDFLEEDERPTCCAATTKVLLVGTSFGKVVLASPEGHVIRVHEHKKQETISTISLSQGGERSVSCALGGSISVQDLFEDSSDFIEISEPPMVSAWRPGLKKNFEIAVGTFSGHVMVITRKMFGGLQSRIVFEDDLRREPVTALAYNNSGDRLCFSTYQAAYVWDPSTNSKLLVGYHNKAAAQLAPPHILWLSNLQLIIARGNTMQWRQCTATELKLIQSLDSNEEICVLASLDAHCLLCTNSSESIPKLVVFDNSGKNLYERDLEILDDDDDAEDISSADFRYCHAADPDSLEDWYYILTPDRLMLCKHERDFSHGQAVAF